MEGGMGTVLIVEDDASVRASLGTIFNRKGYKVIEWPGSTGVDNLIKRLHPDIVLTDHNLNPGEEEGFSLAMRLRADGIKVLLMSADPDIGDTAAANGVPFIQKPFSIQPLLNMIEEVAHA
jgi:DNA-binding NtrC family response regulator